MSLDGSPVAHERFCIIGQVGDPAFALWIARHAARLGLCADVVTQAAAMVQVDLVGPPDLLDAMELGCTLGPWQVLVDRIDRRPIVAPEL